MPVMLIHSDEKLVWNYPGTDVKIYYRRPTNLKQREIQARYTVKGVTNREAVVEELLHECIYDWEGFVDKDGNAVPYKREHLANVPDSLKADFIPALYEVSPQVALGN